MANINLNGSTITFAQDDKLSFNEEEHIYSLDGHKYTSVSNVVGSFFKEFDAEYWSMRKCNGELCTGFNVQVILSLWNSGVIIG